MKRLARAALILSFAVGLSGVASAADSSAKLEATPQGKVYRALLAAMKSGNIAAYKKCMVKANGPMIDHDAKEMGKTPKDVLEFLNMVSPDPITLTDLKVTGKKATMSATGQGKMGDGLNYGTVDLAEEDGQWKVVKQSWTNKKN